MTQVLSVSLRDDRPHGAYLLSSCYRTMPM